MSGVVGSVAMILLVLALVPTLVHHFLFFFFFFMLCCGASGSSLTLFASHLQGDKCVAFVAGAR